MRMFFLNIIEPYLVSINDGNLRLSYVCNDWPADVPLEQRATLKLDFAKQH